MPVLNFKAKNRHEMTEDKAGCILCAKPLGSSQDSDQFNFTCMATEKEIRSSCALQGAYGCSITCDCWPRKTGPVSQPLPKLLHLPEERVLYSEGEVFVLFCFLHRQPFAIQNQGDVSEATACFPALLLSSLMQIK